MATVEQRDIYAMSRQGPAAHAHVAWQPHYLAGGLVVAAITFNLLLAFVNANAMQLGRLHVIAAEVAIVGAALTISLRWWIREMNPWAALLWLLVVLFLGLGLLRGSLDPKFLRDVILIPVFVMLGMTFARGSIVRLFIVAQVVVLAVMVYESLAPGQFGHLFNVSKYYVATRGFVAEDFWHANSELFVSSYRPGDRFLFGSLDIHRLSSVFLEPVSLGNWVVVVVIFVVTVWRQVSPAARGFFLVSNLAILVGCDGRLATVTSALIIAGAWLFARLPARSALLYLPSAVAAAFATVVLLDLQLGADNFGGRLAHSVAVLSRFSIGALFGIDLELLHEGSADSGIAYFVLTQSIVGVAAIWLAICWLQPVPSREARVATHGICVYLSLVLLVSYSLFSIKTAAPLWFLYGYVRAAGVRSEAPTT